MEERKRLVDLHKHGYETTEQEKANFSPVQFLMTNYAFAQIYNLDLFTNCGSHNSTTWAKKVWDLYKAHPEMEQNGLHLFVQSEFTTDISKILTYPDEKHNDEKYVFSEAHVLVAAKKGREQDYFEKTKVYSLWTDMYIKKDTENELTYNGLIPEDSSYEKTFLNIGVLLKSARNILCEKYCKNVFDRIPFDIYENTTQLGLTYTEIRNRFLDDSFDYLVSKNLIPNTLEAKKQLSKDISFVEVGVDKVKNNMFIPFEYIDQLNSNKFNKPLKKYPNSSNHGFARLKLEDFRLLFGDTAHFCLAHPNKINIRKLTGLPASCFEGVDTSFLSPAKQQIIRENIKKYHLTGVDILYKPKDETNIINLYNDEFSHIAGDDLGLVLEQIIVRSLDKYTKKLGFTFEAVEISPRMLTNSDKYKTPKMFLWQHLDLFHKMGKAVNCNSALGDLHMNYERDAGLIDGSVDNSSKNRNYMKFLTYAVTNCSYLELLQTGKFDNKNQYLEIRPLKDFKDPNHPEKYNSKPKNHYQMHKKLNQSKTEIESLELKK